MSMENMIREAALAAFRDALKPLERKVDAIQKQMDALERKVYAVQQRLDGMEQKVYAIQRRLDVMEPPDSGDVMTTGDAAKEMHCTTQSVRHYMETGELKFFIPPGQSRMKTRRAWVNEFIERRAASSMGQ